MLSLVAEEGVNGCDVDLFPVSVHHLWLQELRLLRRSKWWVFMC